MTTSATPSSSSDPTPALQSLSVRLREATAEQHAQAERHRVQQDLVRGRADVRAYSVWLAHMALLHDSFEGHLERAASHPEVARTIQPYHYRRPLIDQDLDALAALARSAGAGTGTGTGTAAAIAAPVATIAEARLGPRTTAEWSVVELMIEVDPCAVLGPFYVLEGSTNGGRFIAAAVRRTLPLPPDVGTRYLDPHGDQIRERWAFWKASLDSTELTAAQQDVIVSAAQRTFDTITHLMDELPG